MKNLIDLIYNRINIKEFLDIYPTNVWNDIIPKVIEIGILNLKSSFGRLKFTKNELINILNELYKSLPPSNYENRNINNLNKYKYENNLLNQNNNNNINNTKNKILNNNIVNKKNNKLNQQNNNKKIIQNNNKNNNIKNKNFNKSMKTININQNKDLPVEFRFERIYKNNSFQNPTKNIKNKSSNNNSVNLYKKRPINIDVNDINYDNFNPNIYHYSPNRDIENFNNNTQKLFNNNNYANTNSYF